MSEAKQGREFVTHELDEAIAVQSAIVKTSRRLAEVHPDPASRRLIKGMVGPYEQNLLELERLGTRRTPCSFPSCANNRTRRPPSSRSPAP